MHWKLRAENTKYNFLSSLALHCFALCCINPTFLISSFHIKILSVVFRGTFYTPELRCLLESHHLLHHMRPSHCRLHQTRKASSLAMHLWQTAQLLSLSIDLLTDTSMYDMHTWPKSVDSPHALRIHSDVRVALHFRFKDLQYSLPPGHFHFFL